MQFKFNTLVSNLAHPYIFFWLFPCRFILPGSYTASQNYINIGPILKQFWSRHLDVLSVFLVLLLLHLCDEYGTIFYNVVKLWAILARWMCRVLKISRKVIRFATIVTNNMSTSSSSSSPSSSSSSLESSAHCRCALILLRTYLSLYSICRSSVHHYLIALEIALIMA